MARASKHGGSGEHVKPSAGVIAIIQNTEIKLRILVGSDAPVHSISQLGLKLESSILADIMPSKRLRVLTIMFLLVWMIVSVYHILRNWNIRQQGRLVNNLAILYGKSILVYDVHSLLHLPRDVESMGH